MTLRTLTTLELAFPCSYTLRAEVRRGRPDIRPTNPGFDVSWTGDEGVDSGRLVSPRRESEISNGWLTSTRSISHGAQGPHGHLYIFIVLVEEGTSETKAAVG